jgi:LmbE family N-acetylglucosaminyl deacetylase
MNLKQLRRRRLALLPLCTLFLAAWIYAEPPGKVLLVVAHPDDEYYCAATVYRLAVQLGGRVDELIITNGEGGFRYSTLAEPYYKESLTIEAIGRKELPAIRRKEALNAGKVLGIKRHYFLDQKDEHFTLDAEDGPRSGWNSALITAKIDTLVKREHYKYVFSILPRSTTHGHHQAATALAAVAILRLPENLRPVLLGFDTDATDFVAPPRIQQTQGWGSSYSYAFDRTTRFGFQNALSYQIVVSWMIAEHKSQGLLQTMHNKDPKEYVWVDSTSAPGAQVTANLLFHSLDIGSAHDEESR